MADEHSLKQTLNGWQIFFIVITVVIGSGCFTDFGVAARTAGPVGLILAVLILGVIAICAMEGLSEMTQIFPTVNPIVELVHEFVDPDLALCVGVSYWFAYASFLALQLSRAANNMNFYADVEHGGWLAAKIAIFYCIAYATIVLINCANVRIFGAIESVGGLFKMVMLLIIVFMLFEITGAAGTAKSFSEGVFPTLKYSSTAGSAVCCVIESIAFSYLGIETFAITAFEAKETVDLRIPSKFMAYAAFGCYILLSISTSLCLDWKNAVEILDLVDQYFTVRSTTEPGTPSSTMSALIVAALKVNEQSLAQAMNGMFIFCAVSAANSTLYVSSRMLYGLAYMNRWRNKKWIDRLASVRKNGVPCFAVYISAASFVWLPFTQVMPTSATSRLLSWFFTTGSICIFFMWFSICLAYLRYWFAFRKFRRQGVLQDPDRLRFNRWSNERGFSTFLRRLQPVPAFIGLFGSVLIVWVFSSAMFWGRSIRAGQFFLYYSTPLILPFAWFARKVYVWQEEKRVGRSFYSQRHLQWWNEFNDEQRVQLAIETLSEFSKPSQRRQSVAFEMQTTQMNGVLPAERAPQEPA